MDVKSRNISAFEFTPLVLLVVYVILYIVLGSDNAFTLMAIIGTGGSILAAFLRFLRRPKRDTHGRFHDGKSGKYISSGSGYFSLSCTAAAIIMPFIDKPNFVGNVMSFVSNLSPEAQVAYIVISHGIGFGLSH